MEYWIVGIEGAVFILMGNRQGNNKATIKYNRIFASVKINFVQYRKLRMNSLFE